MSKEEEDINNDEEKRQTLMRLKLTSKALGHKTLCGAFVYISKKDKMDIIHLFENEIRKKHTLSLDRILCDLGENLPEPTQENILEVQKKVWDKIYLR